MGSRLDSNSAAVRKRIENHTFDNEQGEEYKPSKFGGFSDYFRRKKIKLQNLDTQLRAEAPDNPRIFRGIVAHVNGYTQPSLNDLHHLIVTHGGGFMQYLDGKTTVTHIIASSLTPKKAIEFRKYRIVKPAWIVDSVNAGKLLPWENYRVLDEGAGQKILKFQDGKVSTQINRKPTGYRDQTETSWYTKQLNATQVLNGIGEPVDLDLCDPVSSDIDYLADDLDLDLEDYDPQSAEKPSTSKQAEEPIERSELSPGPRGMLAPIVNPNEDSPPSYQAPLITPDTALKDIDAPEPARQLSELSVLQQGAQRESEDFKPTSGLGQLSDGVDESLEQATEESHPQSDVPSGKKRRIEIESIPEAKRAKLSAEEHNTILLADPRIRKSSVLNPDFLEQYYRESRLHHLSTWKADLKSQLQALTAEQSSSHKARQKRAPGARRYILHVDFDSFFVAVSLRNHPEYVDKPAVVAHGSGTGSEIASCNYPARTYGVKNGMWMKRAQDMCQDLKVLPYDFPAYEAASRTFYDAIMRTGGIVQSVSIDEALVDVSVTCHSAGGTDGTGVREGSIWREQEKANEIAQDIRNKVKQGTGCAVSVGIGSNILLAKVGLRKAKPAGQHQIKPEEALEFIGDLEVQNLPGVAYSIGGKLEEIGIKFVKDIREFTRERLISVLGPKTGEKIWNYSRGIDKTEIGDQVVRKSVSAEVNWGVRFETSEQAEEFVENLCGELDRRLVKEGVKGKQLTMKIMRKSPDAPLDPPKHLGHGKCDTYNKSVVLGVSTNSKDILARECISILRGHGFSPGELRGLGVQMTKLEPLKAATSAGLDGSQRRLQFKFSEGPSKPETKEPTGPAVEDNARREPSQFKSREATSKFATKDTAQDPVEDPETPQKLRATQNHSSQIPALIDTPSRKPLNMLGTQFLLPSQVDPKVLSELPEDIKSRLAARSAAPPAQIRPSRSPSPSTPSRSKNERSKDSIPSFTALPSHSQLDPQFLDSLPPDLRDEILAEYHDASPPRRGQGNRQQQQQQQQQQQAQSLLPQSPRRNRVVRNVGTTSTRGTLSGRGRPRGGSLLSRLRGSKTGSSRSAAVSAATLTQTNFVSAPVTSRSRLSSRDGNDRPPPEEPDKEFLAALPDDVRVEVFENHKREVMRHKTGLEVARSKYKGRAGYRGLGLRNMFEGRDESKYSYFKGERVLHLEPRAPRPSFTVEKLSKATQLRGAIRGWIEEFLEEGPYDEDLEAVGRDLVAGVGKEGDMRKAVAVVRWFGWVLDGVEVRDVDQDDADVRNEVDGNRDASKDTDGTQANTVREEEEGEENINATSKTTTSTSGLEKWQKALEKARIAVQEAVKARGLGEVDFEA